MEYHNVSRPSDALVHWGVKGMKWGIRRYQNKDGSLTAAGKKRRAKLEGELEKLGGESQQKKSVSEMTNKELQEHTTRMQLEKQYYDAQRNLASMNPKQVSMGKKYAEKLLNDAIIPSVSNAGKAYIEKMLKERMGISTEDPVSALKKEYDLLKYKTDIDKMKNPDKYMSWDDKTKQYDLERKKRTHAAEDEAAAKAEADKAKAEAKAAKDSNLNARREAQGRAASDTANSRFINKVTKQPVPRSAVKNVIGDAIVLKDQTYLDYKPTKGNIDRGKTFVDDYVNGEDDD